MRLGHLPAACLLALMLACMLPVAVLADGDPASDILPANDTYLPYSPKVAPDEAKQLQDLVAAARAKGAAFKVAIIATKVDLGAVPELFDMPASNYAKFLYSEIRTFVDGENGTLLIVKPGGAGIAGKLATKAGRAAAAKVHVPADATPTQLAAAAITAMHAVAQANGTSLPDAGGGGSNTTTIVVITLAAVAFAAGIALILRGRRPPPAPSTGAA